MDFSLSVPLSRNLYQLTLNERRKVWGYGQKLNSLENQNSKIERKMEQAFEYRRKWHTGVSQCRSVCLCGYLPNSQWRRWKKIDNNQPQTEIKIICHICLCWDTKLKWIWSVDYCCAKWLQLSYVISCMCSTDAYECSRSRNTNFDIRKINRIKSEWMCVCIGLKVL